MEQIITVFITGICGVLTAGFGFIIAYLVKKTKQLEEKNKLKDAKIESLHNGFRQDVFNSMVEVKSQIKDLKTDMKLVKGLVVENKKHYKQIESKK